MCACACVIVCVRDILFVCACLHACCLPACMHACVCVCVCVCDVCSHCVCVFVVIVFLNITDVVFAVDDAPPPFPLREHTFTCTFHFFHFYLD